MTHHEEENHKTGAQKLVEKIQAVAKADREKLGWPEPADMVKTSPHYLSGAGDSAGTQRNQKPAVESTVYGVVTRVIGENSAPVRLVRKRFEDNGNGVGLELAKFMATELNKRHHPRGTNEPLYWVEDVTGQGDNEEGFVRAGGAFEFSGDIDGVRTDKIAERRLESAEV